MAGIGQGHSIGWRRNPGLRSEGGTGVPGPVSTAPIKDGLIGDFDANRGLTLVGDRVQQWNDLSLALNHVSAGGVSNRPRLIFKDPFFNGNNSIEADSSTVELARATLTGGAAAQANTIFVVARWNRGGYLTDGQGATRHIVGENVDVPGIFAGTWLTGASGDVTPGVRVIAQAVFDGANSEIRVEQNIGDTFSLTGDAGAQALNGLKLFATAASQGIRSARYLIYDRRLNIDEVTQTLQYLRQTYDVTPLSLIPGLIADYNPAFFTESGGNVTAAPDNSGNGNDLTVNGTVPYTASNPTLNNRPTVTSDDATGYLIRPSWTTGTAAQPFTTIFVSTWAVAANDMLACNGANALASFERGASSLPRYDAGTTVNGATSLTTGEKFVVTITWDGANFTAEYDLDEKPGFVDTGNVGTTASDGITLLARGTTQNRFWTGDLARAAVFNRRLGITEQQAIRRCLRAKYGIGEYDAEAIIATAIADYDVAAFTESGGNVATAPDSSGNGNDLSVVGTVPYTPTDVDFALRPSISGATANNYLTRVSFTGGALSQPTSIYLVGTWTQTLAQPVLCSGGTGAARQQYMRNGPTVQLFAGASLQAGTEPAAGQPFVAACQFNGASSDLRVEPNGTNVITASGNVGSAGLDGFSLLASFNGTTPWTDGKLARAIVFNRLLTTDEDAQVRAYLRSIYGITPA